jgi:hypothetical protein
MNRSISRSIFFGAAVLSGALAFGLILSGNVHGYLPQTGPWCPGTTSNTGPAATMCVNGVTVPNVPPPQQTKYLTGGGSVQCMACNTSN